VGFSVTDETHGGQPLEEGKRGGILMAHVNYRGFRNNCKLRNEAVPPSAIDIAAGQKEGFNPGVKTILI
jgi:hypothetical protein